MSTQGDIILDTPLAKIGGKGLFVKELEQAMLDGRADIAVHSMKDVPVEFPEGLALHTICEREDPRDAFVSNNFKSLDALPQGAIVGTSSLRRQCQIREARPDLDIRDLRGNVNTRLAKLDDGQYDAIILAAAGLIRLEMPERITALLAPLEHTETRIRVNAERAMNRRLEGGCQVPIGAFALVNDDHVYLRGLVGAVDGSQMLRDDVTGPVADAEKLGIELAEKLLAQGADKILADVYRDA